MFTIIKIKNIAGFSDEITLDLTANKRDRTGANSVKELPDGTLVNKIAGIIAGNACGKTTILNALESVGSFIHAPLRKKAAPKFSDIPSNDGDEERERIFNRLMEEYGYFELPAPNYKNRSDNARIELQMYIDSGEKPTTGYYRYILEYSKNYEIDGIVLEALYFKKKFNSQVEKTIFEISGSFESEIG